MFDLILTVGVYFCGLSEANRLLTSASEMDLFDDLPEPTNDPGPVTAKKPEEEERGEKRKRDVSSQDTEVEDKKQEEKKICRS